MSDQIIRMQKLCYRIGQKYLLRDIDWQLQRGEHCVVFGLNGSGKTTLLSVAAGYKTATSGCLQVFGQDYTADNILDNRRRIGLVSNSYFDRYYRQESALDIVLSGALGTLGLDFDIDDGDVQLALELLRQVGLSDRIGQPYGAMSKGERQNVLIARALMAKPELLVLDELCSGLDVLARERVLGTVQGLADAGEMTIVYVTHYTEEILPCFETTLLLKKGRIYASGDSRKLLTSAQMSQFLEEAVVIERDQRGRIQLQADVS